MRPALVFRGRDRVASGTVGTRSTLGRRARILWACTLTAVAMGCGDIGNLRVELEFPDAQTEAQTRALLYRAREVPAVGSGCGALWADRQPANLRQKESVVEYPNRTDVRALGIDLAPYDELTIFVYAYATIDVGDVQPLAGGCAEAPVNGDSTRSIQIRMMRRP